ncbi:MAG: 5'-deoxynucleotidase, partial [Oscillibacter sp.]
MKSHFFAYISRMRFISRWALMRNTAPENVQEHSHQVAVLAHALAVIRNELFGGMVDAGAVAAAALYHDASEILTGDLPTPIKYFNPVIKSAYKDIESVANDKLLHLLPPELQGVYGPILGESDPEIALLVKAADKLSAYIKCVEELKAGNAEFREAAAQTRKALEAFGLPETAYFLETFMP